MKLISWLGLCLVLASSATATAQISVTGFNGLSAAISSNGSWSVSASGLQWQWSGTTGTTVSNTRTNSSTDNLGSYQELAFDYVIGASTRSASIRVYTARPLVLFSVTYNNGSANTSPFPVFSAYPLNLLHLSFNGEFAHPSFTDLLPESPWIYFDGAANTFIVSPASDYMTAATTPGANGQIQAGISSQIATLPAGMTHRTLLAVGQGINQTLSTWGKALTDLTGKTRPANDADALLKSVSYWTDNGATYYYNPGGNSYTGTLEAVKAEFSSKGISLGSLQLDSWWYPKGPDNAWSSHGGIWTYTASSAIFQPDLATFQTNLGIPMAAHARWIDAASPYRGQYVISGNVATDPQYWEDVASYLQASGVATYEQDWLATNAQADFNLTDPVAFLDNMAASMAKRGITMQYCMATPRHFLQGTNYNNLTTIRTSGDGFGADHWTEFLYGAQLASALGTWPFTDVLMSGDINSLILATLSAGPVGVGDALGSLSAVNLLHAVRSDGVIVKPDLPVAPVDSVFISDAQGVDTPMVASTYSDFGGQRTNYIFAYTRTTAAPITIAPASYGINGAAWLYDYTAGAGYLIPANGSQTLNLTAGTGYFILTAVGQSGIAMVGDRAQFVTMGKQRVSAFSDTGVVDVSLNFAAREKVRTLTGYSPGPVVVASLNGRAEPPVWDPTTQLFTLRVHTSEKDTARVHIVTAANTAMLGANATVCGVRCGKRHASPIVGNTPQPTVPVAPSQQ